eukprot:GHVN01038887.1.p1 GENE.GHVN01038887.1~~GHVN01038887.1.p1  ORF type:complete len:432 (-),score=152.79 GHVN01038887.1:319-1527(-)
MNQSNSLMHSLDHHTPPPPHSSHKRLSPQSSFQRPSPHLSHQERPTYSTHSPSCNPLPSTSTPTTPSRSISHATPTPLATTPITSLTTPITSLTTPITSLTTPITSLTTPVTSFNKRTPVIAGHKLDSTSPPTPTSLTSTSLTSNHFLLTPIHPPRIEPDEPLVLEASEDNLFTPDTSEVIECRPGQSGDVSEVSKSTKPTSKRVNDVSEEGDETHSVKPVEGSSLHKLYHWVDELTKCESDNGYKTKAIKLMRERCGEDGQGEGEVRIGKWFSAAFLSGSFSTWKPEVMREISIQSSLNQVHCAKMFIWARNVWDQGDGLIVMEDCGTPLMDVPGRQPVASLHTYLTHPRSGCKIEKRGRRAQRERRRSSGVPDDEDLERRCNLSASLWSIHSTTRKTQLA